MFKKFLPALASVFVGVAAQAFPIITNVVETGGDNEATDTIVAQWTGTTFVTGIAGEPVPGKGATDPYTAPVFGNHAPAYVDRNHRWTNASATVQLPPYLVGREYILIGNDNRDNASLTLDVSVVSNVFVYLLIDNRMGPVTEATARPNDPPTFGAGAMQWVLDEGWLAVTNGINRTMNFAFPDEIGIDESADGTINNWSSVYVKYYPAGTFQLRQADNTGRNMYGAVVAAAVLPGVPTGLAAASADAKVTLSWGAASDAGGYIIKRSLTPGGPYEIIATNFTRVYMDTSVVNGGTYYYVVSGFNLAGEGADSNEAVGTPKAAPTGVVATGGVEQIVITWDAFAGAASYTVLRSSVSGGPYTAIASGIAGTTYTDTTIAGGQTYYYVVTAQLTVGGESGQSAEAAGFAAPVAPVVTASRWAVTANRVSWTSSNTVVASYWIEQSTDGVNFTILTNIPVPASFHVDAELTPGTTYYYRVQAENASGQSPYSNIASNTTPTFGLNVNFANALNGTPANNPAPIPPGYAQDVGETFGLKTNGLTYGWDRDITVDGRWRNNANSPDLRYDTFNHLQKALPSAVWEIEIPNGFYSVRIVSGDPTATDSTFHMNVEGVIGSTYVPVGGAWWADVTIEAGVSDGRLTITSGPSAANNKINFVDIYPAIPVSPVIGTQPVGATAEEYHPVILSVVMSQGSQPFRYQWYLNSAPITDATNAVYALPHVRMSDAGTYFVVVTNFGGAVTSSAVSVIVQADTTPPQMTGVASIDGKTIGVCFSEELDNSSQQVSDYFTYLVNNGANSVTNVIVRPGTDSVILQVDPPLAGEFFVAVNTVNPNLTDLAGNLMPPTTLTNTVAGWFAGDVGSPGLLGHHFSCDLDEIEIVGGGADVWSASDQFYLISRFHTGDFDARVRVVSLMGSNAITKAVLVARESNDANARAYHISVNPTPPGRNQIELGLRSTLGGTTASWGATYTPANIPNVWLRITRVGDTFTGYRSTNGATWVPMGTNTLAMPASMAVGIGVTAHDNSLIATGAFSNFTLTGGLPPQPIITNLGFGGAGQFNLSFVAQVGVSYRIEYKNDLSDPAWTLLTTVMGAGATANISDPGATTNRRFYRVRTQ
jgi:fibronectin type 3 domain-containing protein